MYNIRAIERAFKLLECFSTQKPKMGVTEISEYIGLSKATTFRITETLEQLGYLSKDESTQTYSLGAKILSLGRVFLDDLDYRAVALPYMKQIRDSLDETVSLYIIVNNKRVCVERIHSSLALRRVVSIGEEVPLQRGASGRILLAYSGIDLGLDKEVLAKVRQDGYTYSNNERGEGISAISVPIRSHNPKFIAAMTASGPSFRYNEFTLPRYIEVMKAASTTISGKLGFIGH